MCSWFVRLIIIENVKNLETKKKNLETANAAHVVCKTVWYFSHFDFVFRLKDNGAFLEENPISHVWYSKENESFRKKEEVG